MRRRHSVLASPPDWLRFLTHHHAFFKQAILQRQVRHAVLQIAGLTAQILHLVTGGSAGGVARQAPLARLHELPGPCIIQALRDAFLAAQLGNAVIAAKAFQHDPDLVLGCEVSAGRSANVAMRSAHGLRLTTFSAVALGFEDLGLIFVPSSLRRDPNPP
jgi:hypothetical protein